MKLFSFAAAASLLCTSFPSGASAGFVSSTTSHARLPSSTKMLSHDVNVELKIGIKTKLDHSEMHRIFSNPNHLTEHEEDKKKMADDEKLYYKECFELFHSLVDKINKNGASLNMVPLWTDKSGFLIQGSVRDFISFLQQASDSNEGHQHNAAEGLFISFEEETGPGKKQVIKAKYDNGKSALKIAPELMECVAYFGSFKKGGKPGF